MEPVICPTCKCENPVEAKFCMNCGEPFHPASTPAPVTDKSTRKLKAEPAPSDSSTIRLPTSEDEAVEKPKQRISSQEDIEEINKATTQKDSSTIRLSAEEVDEIAVEIESDQPRQDFSTVKLTPEELDEAVEELKAEKSQQDFSTVRLSADELASAASEGQSDQSKRDFSTVQLSADELTQAAVDKTEDEPEKDMSTEHMESNETLGEQPAVDAGEAIQPPRRFCANCGQQVKPGIKFCDECGARIDGEAGGAPLKPPGTSVKAEPPLSEPPVEEPPAKPPKRRRRTGCIIGTVLLCLLLVAAAITAVVYQEEIKAMIGLTTATPVAQVVETIGRPSATPRPPDTETPTPTQTLIPSPTYTLTPTPPPPRTLTICLGSEPDTLYLYGSNMLAQQQVLDAVYDGPIDQYGFDYHAVILEKLPSLADGDAMIEATNVRVGDMVVNNDDVVVQLANGEVVRPAGCRSADCAITYNGGNLQMDGMRVTFRILPGLTWSDGSPLTASDSMYSFNVGADPDTPTGKYYYERTASYSALDDLTIEWAGLPGYLDTTYFARFWSPLPEHVLGGYPAASLEYTDLEELLLGWGPYIFHSYTQGVEITFTRNPNYFRADEGLPVFSDLVIRFIASDGSSAIAALLAGECDILDRGIYLEDQGQTLLDMDAAGALDAIFWSNQVWEHADFNIRPVPSIINSGDFAGWDLDRDGQGPFGDVRLRQAVASCMDRQAVVDTIYFGRSSIMDTILPPDHPLIAPELPTWPYNPEFGQALLDEIGWVDADNNPSTPRTARNVTGVPNGTPLTFFYETTTAQQRQQALQILSETISQCGIGVNVVHWPSTEWFADGPDGRLFGRQFDLGQFAWIITGGTACDLYMSNNIPSDELGWFGQNETGFSNPDFDAACNLVLQTLPGETGYTENTWEVQYILASELPVVPLYTRLNINVTRSDFCHFIPASTSFSEMWNLEAFDYGEGCP